MILDAGPEEWLHWPLHANQHLSTIVNAWAACRPAPARRCPSQRLIVGAQRSPSQPTLQTQPGYKWLYVLNRQSLKADHLTGSMGRVASASDNAAMESLFSVLQGNVLDQRRWRTRSNSASRSSWSKVEGKFQSRGLIVVWCASPPSSWPGRSRWQSKFAEAM